VHTVFTARGYICIVARSPPPCQAGNGSGADPPYGEAPFPFFLPHRASAALRAISWRRSGLILSVRTLAEAIPPFRPKTTA